MYAALRHVLAAFTGRCEWCDDEIDEGDAIVCVDDTWIHRECAEDEGYEVI